MDGSAFDVEAVGSERFLWDSVDLSAGSILRLVGVYVAWQQNFLRVGLVRCSELALLESGKEHDDLETWWADKKIQDLTLLTFAKEALPITPGDMRVAKEAAQSLGVDEARVFKFFCSLEKLALKFDRVYYESCGKCNRQVDALECSKCGALEQTTPYLCFRGKFKERESEQVMRIGLFGAQVG